jgi:AcrR family transcriptional regulator
MKKRKPKLRVRRTAEEARAAILDAAEKRLIASGPAAIRLQEVAAAVGVSHPTVLHHFGSREGLVKAVCERSFAGINADVIASFGRSSGEGDIAPLIEDVFATLASQGRARVLTWLALESIDPGHGDPVHLSEVVAAAHATLEARGRATTRDETAYSVVLTTLALTAEAVMGRYVMREAGLDEQSDGAGFRAWLAKVLVTYFQERASGAAP